MGLKERLQEMYHKMMAWKPDRNSPWVRGLRMMRLSGVKEALKDDTPCPQRLFWALIFSLSLTVGIMLSLDTFQQFWKKPILHTFHDGGVSVDRIPFPGVTVSNPYLLKRSTLDQASEMYSRSVLNHYIHKKPFQMDGVNWNITDTGKLIFLIDHYCEQANSYGKLFKVIDTAKSIPPQDEAEFTLLNNISLFDDVKDLTYTEKIIPLIQTGIINCTDIIIGCLWQGYKSKTCLQLFQTIQTDVGTGCSFNKMPDHILRADKGIKSKLHGYVADYKDDSKWENWKIDEHSFLGRDYSEEEGNFLPRRQTVPGFDRGLSFLLKHEQNNQDIACPIMDTEDYLVCIHHPFEEPKIKLDGCLNVPAGYQVLIKLQAQITLANSKIRKLPPETRDCYFESEKNLTFFKRYTKGNCFKDCLGIKVKTQCGCLPLSITSGNNERICSRLHANCVKNVTRSMEGKGYRQECPTCLRPCTEISYKAEATYTKIKFDDPQGLNLSVNESYSLVHVYFHEDLVISHERSLLYDNNELIGVLGGIIGLTNGVDLLQMFNILAGLAIWFPVWEITKRCIGKCNTRPPFDEESQNVREEDPASQMRSIGPHVIGLPQPSFNLTETQIFTENETGLTHRGRTRYFRTVVRTDRTFNSARTVDDLERHTSQSNLILRRSSNHVHRTSIPVETQTQHTDVVILFEEVE